MSSAALFHTRYPIIQAPMAGVQDYQLAAAVSNAGGLGSLPCAMLTPAALSEQLARLAEVCDAPVNLNFFCHSPSAASASAERRWRHRLQPYFEQFGGSTDGLAAGPARQPFSAEMAAVIAEYRPAVVSFHFGLPNEALLSRVQSWGTKVIASATTVEEALWLQAHGADGIIVQGLEAGGHRGHFLRSDLSLQSGLMALLPQVAAAVSLPVIAAGGIADRQGVAAALKLGASAVQVGTAFLLCDEAKTSELHRQALQSPAAGHTTLTTLFSGRPARGIVNRVIRELGPRPEGVPAFPHASGAITALRQLAEAQHSSDFSPLWCGQNASGCRAIPAAALLEGLLPKS
ncbi:nitronate monooxygenase family protein [Ferrimonas sp. SCSIO 43195]|uniref:NAD(P)H-dependent flavin oxidoreductase n=1 Tax=Ferrimonas sp. SCSIO 43195 TaxID=2822844 RepID=UPI002074C8EB|nr:nitronate monooxygenase [Ferrimonas sp. SCSIO 43195]USD38345.1 nitronate monooxygenase [Ferrimonas sp. SCSIO 43195]